jgi:hypothetical protein
MIKALSLLQPWASLVVMGAKRIETRSWKTAYRGILMIHASKGRSGAGIVQMPMFEKYIPDFNDLPFGAIIGEVNLTAVVRIEELSLSSELVNKLSMEERAFGDYGAGRFAWLFEDAQAYEHPIPAKGSLGLWEAG